MYGSGKNKKLMGIEAYMNSVREKGLKRMGTMTSEFESEHDVKMNAKDGMGFTSINMDIEEDKTNFRNKFSEAYGVDI